MRLVQDNSSLKKEQLSGRANDSVRSKLRDGSCEGFFSATYVDAIGSQVRRGGQT